MAVTTKTGRLELTWTNKHLTLLAGEDGAYEWVEPTDVRVAETRLLDEVAAVGEVGPQSCAAADNLLIQGDSLQALRSLRRLPEFARHYSGKVQLIYIDPPFNTGQAFANYDDALEHSVWLTMMRDRLVELKQMLAPNGSIWVHLDDREQHRTRAVLDELFGEAAFVASIVWQKRLSRESRSAFSSAHDLIHVYSPVGPERWKQVRNREQRSAEDYSNPDNDPRGPWRDGGPFTAPGYRENQRYVIVNDAGIELRPQKRTRSWFATEPEYLRMHQEGRIFFTRNGAGQPRMKAYQSEEEGLVPFTLWEDTNGDGEPAVDEDSVFLASAAGTNDDAKRHGQAMFDEAFATPKPESLLQRIVHIASSPGDIVLDCFVGSGTTAAVAHKMGRRWVAIEREGETVDTFARPRLEKVVKGEDPGGITTAVEWDGGGGFRLIEVGGSMYDLDEDGEIFLSSDVTNGRFAEAVRAQLSFVAEDEPPFCGRKGRARLAVMDGVVGEIEARHLIAALGEGERLVLVAKAVDDDVEPLLAELSPGSRIRKAPRDLVRSVGRIVR